MPPQKYPCKPLSGALHKPCKSAHKTILRTENPHRQPIQIESRKEGICRKPSSDILDSFLKHPPKGCANFFVLSFGHWTKSNRSFHRQIYTTKTGFSSENQQSSKTRSHNETHLNTWFVSQIFTNETNWSQVNRGGRLAASHVPASRWKEF